MDRSGLGDYAIADCGRLEDSSSVDHCAFAAQFLTSDYVRVTQLYCDGVGRQYKDFAESERNLEFDICNMWCSKPASVLRGYCDAIKIHIFWPLLFQHQHRSVISRLFPCVEASKTHASEISLKQLQHLELMEDIVDLAKKVVNDPFFIGGLLRVGYKIENKILAMEEALNWVKYTGDVTILPKLGAVDNCWPLLSIFFTEYKYHITKVVTENYNILEEFKRQNCAECIEQGELMKTKGNEEFSKERFDIAIIYYSRAIEYSPENHLLYGNRALCFLRMGQFRNALGDGKRAIILKNNWTKGHYRYCAALSVLGEYEWALQANLKAQKLCRSDPEGIKDLIQQHAQLQKQTEQGGPPTRYPIKAFFESRAFTPSSSSAPAFSTSLNFVETEKDSRKTNRKMAKSGNQNVKVVDEALWADECDCHSELLPPPPPCHPPKYKGKQKSRNNELEFSYSSQRSLSADLKNILEREFSKSSRAAHQDFANIMKMLRSLIQDGYIALLEQRCRSAAQAFSELLHGLDPQKIKQLNLAMINYVLVVYGLAISLLGIGQPEELSEAENQFKRMIEHYPNEGLDCLAYCGIGKVYLKKNRFLEALHHFEKARTLICRLPGVLTWPTSNVIIEDTQPGKIKMLLEKFIEECRFPPVPDAVCCYQKCHGYSKMQIYVTDPDFKGFIRISCCQYCKIEFHMNCWKKLKTTTYNDKIDKDFLQGICLTPDCQGVISKIIIFSSGGQVKCEFEHKVVKEKVPPRPILKQKCSSLEKLRQKEDKKMKRKIQKKEAKKLAQERMEEDLRENPPKTEKQKESAARGAPSQPLDDRLLQCIKQAAGKIKSGVLNTARLLRELLSWKVLRTEDYTTCFSSRNFLNEAVDYVIRHLVQEKNRVKTRIFLHVLSELKEVEPKLASWIQKLNSFGLDAAGSFFSRYGASLKELDFSLMASLWNEKYGHKLSSIEGKQLDYFCGLAPRKEARCLIWLLEDHRHRFPALHSALDEFFDIMDSRCTVLRKQDSEDAPFNSTKIKNKGKKKKPKDLKPMLVGSGAASVTANNETLAEDHNRRNSSAAGPFVVPDHLRQDVEEFEALYEQHNSEYVVRNKKLWDINPKQKCSTLYDYFSQLLEEHGPLDMNNKMFSEEYEFFPEETRQILEKAGGLKAFLLQCPRFVVIDNCIALRKVASRLKKKRKKKNLKTKVEEMSKAGECLRVKLPLNPTAREFKPDVKSRPASGLSSAPAPEDARPRPGPADSPPPACEAASPKPVLEDSPRSPPEDEEPREASPDPCKPASGGAVQPQAAAASPQAAPEGVKAAYWTQAHLVTGYCTYLPFTGFDISQTPPAYISVVPSLPQYTSIYTPLATMSSEYPLQRSMPLVPSYVPSDGPDKCTAVHLEGPPAKAECAPGDQIASETQILFDSSEISVGSQCGPGGAGATHSEPSRDDGDREDSAPREASPEEADEAANVPRPQAAALQVSGNVTHQKVNTEPYGPFEAQQGEISQIEKEYHALQEQLKEACESYEQRKLQGSEETKDLEEKLKRNIEENKISKTELDWFLEDLKKEIKKWQQEKKEVQERLKVLKKQMKRVSNATELYTQKNDGKNTEHEFLLDQSLEISNAFTNEKMKVEENIKKGKKDYEEILQRAVAAEVSVLEIRKETEVYKLQAREARAEQHLKALRQRSSDSAVHLDLESDMNAWESFLSDVRKEIEKAESQFEEQIKAVRSGSRLSELSGVQVSEPPLPACSTVHPESLREAPCPEGQGPTAWTSCAGDQPTVPEDSSLASTGDSPPQPVSPPREPKAPRPQEHGPAGDRKSPVAPARAARPGQPPRRPFNSLMEHLSAAFPCASSSELAGFIKKVRNKSKNSLSGLSVDEIVQRVTKHILDEQENQKLSPGRPEDRRRSAPSPAVTVTGAFPGPPSEIAGPPLGTPGQRTEDVLALGARGCELCHKVVKPRNTHVLPCGHKVHKGCFQQRPKGQSTCPACGDRGRLSGKQPAPSGRGLPS